VSDRGERRWQKERERERVKGGCFLASSGVFDACAAFVLFVLTLCVCCTSRDQLITTEKKRSNPNTSGLPKQGVKHISSIIYLLCKNWSRSHYMIASMFLVKVTRFLQRSKYYWNLTCYYLWWCSAGPSW